MQVSFNSFGLLTLDLDLALDVALYLERSTFKFGLALGLWNLGAPTSDRGLEFKPWTLCVIYIISEMCMGFSVFRLTLKFRHFDLDLSLGVVPWILD